MTLDTSAQHPSQMSKFFTCSILTPCAAKGGKMGCLFSQLFLEVLTGYLGKAPHYLGIPQASPGLSTTQRPPPLSSPPPSKGEDAALI